MTALGTLATTTPPVIPDFGWEPLLVSYTFTVNGDNYPPLPPAYSSSVNYALGADVYYSGNEYVCIQVNGPATTVQAPTATAYWEVVPNRFYNYQTPLNTVITFDAIDSLALGLPKVYTPTGISIISYEWDFGNGLLGFGSTANVTYTYPAAPPDIQTKLTVTDTLGRRYSVAHRLELVNAKPAEGMGYKVLQSNVGYR